MIKNDKCECGSRMLIVIHEKDYGDVGVYRKKKCVRCNKINHFVEYKVKPDPISSVFKGD